MYIHVGEDILVQSKDIIAIIDKQSVSSSKTIEEFLERQKHTIINLSKGSYKSVVITTTEIYFSPLASGTLKKRSNRSTIQEY
ncbi:DUF370 domain-containing protein [Bacillus sp. FJAT-49705]|uniref:DUF370 domain-containing protein n=1 Tax=Cytobacillus citreus TaxID=2833586 RepID=A0ABS5NRP9_9BACI|nr:extracellular matrix/biofilm biosynthesis regulator RemA family protein [Cytobacillus citreus]MBS4189828.1 DUF370 domain-containing protein [Cytobacillus citreus]